MRLLAIVAIVVLGVGLATVQFVASVALRDDAQSPSWVRFVPPALATRVDELSPDLPLPAALRLVLARRALESGRLALAEEHLAHMDPSRDRDELVGLLAERGGDERAAVLAFLAAGDVAGVEERVAQLAATGRIDEALQLQRAVLARVQQDPAEAGALPEAYYRLAGLEQDAAYRLDSDARGPLERASATDYERAVALAPLEERYLIAAGNEQINLGDFDAALAYFRRVRDVDPNSVDALTGFGDVALRLGKTSEARAYLAQAKRLKPDADSVKRLAKALGE